MKKKVLNLDLSSSLEIAMLVVNVRIKKQDQCWAQKENPLLLFSEGNCLEEEFATDIKEGGLRWRFYKKKTLWLLLVRKFTTKVKIRV